MKVNFYLITLLTLNLFSCSVPETPKEEFAVKRIVDGDTFWIDDGSKKGVKIRIIGIDTPEIEHEDKSGEFYGEEAKAFLKELIANKAVQLSYDVERKDKYGRTLAYVYVDDSIFVNAELVKRGYAHTLRIPPNTKNANYFQQLQNKAKENKLGIWQ